MFVLDAFLFSHVAKTPDAPDHFARQALGSRVHFGDSSVFELDDVKAFFLRVIVEIGDFRADWLRVFYQPHSPVRRGHIVARGHDGVWNMPDINKVLIEGGDLSRSV